MKPGLSTLGTVFALLLPASVTGATEAKFPDAGKLLSRVSAKYRAASAYESSGTATVHVLRPEEGTENESGIRFGILLARPCYYRIAWTQETATGSAAVGAIWNRGDGPYLYDSSRQGYTRLASDNLAFSASAGASMGVSQALPDLFFGAENGKLDRLRDVLMEGEDTQDGIPCYAVSGRLQSSVAYHLWIVTNGLDLVRIDFSLGGKGANHVVPETTPEQKRETLRAMGMEITAENLAYVDQARAKVREMIRNVRGTSRHHYRNIRTAFATVPADFEYDMPEGTGELPGPDPASSAGNDKEELAY